MVSWFAETIDDFEDIRLRCWSGLGCAEGKSNDLNYDYLSWSCRCSSVAIRSWRNLTCMKLHVPHASTQICCRWKEVSSPKQSVKVPEFSLCSVFFLPVVNAPCTHHDGGLPRKNCSLDTVLMDWTIHQQHLIRRFQVQLQADHILLFYFISGQIHTKIND